MKQYQIPNIIAGSIASAGIWLFAGFIHSNTIVAISGLLLASLSISVYAGGFAALIRITGLSEYKKKLIPFIFAGLLLGTCLGMLYNLLHHEPLIPLPLTLSAIIAPVVGIVEELVFRGFIQGAVSKTSSWLGIFFASGSHTIYKVLVLWTFPLELEINLFNLAMLTFSAGLLFGWLRKASDNIIPPALAHGSFDIAIYGGLLSLPVWVWG